MEKKYPDTRAGVQEYLKEGTCLKVTKTSKYTPDPAVEGVWKVTNLEFGRMRGDCIVYLAGYKDPWGQIRETNDSEEFNIHE